MPKKTSYRVDWNGEAIKRQLTGSVQDKVGIVVETIVTDVKTTFGSRGTPNVRTGALRGSISGDWTGSGKARGQVDGKARAAGATGIKVPAARKGETIGVVGTNLVYARIHEMGGVIRPVKKKWLTIPFPGSRTAGGAGRGSAREFNSTFIAKGIIFGKPTASSKQIVPLFILKKKVTIPARPYLRPALERARATVKRALSEI